MEGSVCSPRPQTHLATCPAGRSPDMNPEALEAFKKFTQRKGLPLEDIFLPTQTGERATLPTFLSPPFSSPSYCVPCVLLCPYDLLSPPTIPSEGGHASTVTRPRDPRRLRSGSWFLESELRLGWGRGTCPGGHLTPGFFLVSTESCVPESD